MPTFTFTLTLMARINNQAVMQKLIDDLNLYPGADIIPTELAEKVLPVFNVNEQDVNVTIEDGLQLKTANIVRGAHGLVAASTTLYAVPATGDFYLTGVTLGVRIDAAVGTTCAINVTISGASQQVLIMNCIHIDSSRIATLSLPYPIKVDKSTNITLTNTTANVICSGSIIGRYVAP